MQTVAFHVYIPDTLKKNNLSNNLLIGLATIFGCLIVCIFRSYFEEFKFLGYFTFCYFVILLIVSIYLGIVSFWRFRLLYGRIEGRIEFNEKGITIDNHLLELEHILIKRLIFDDYHGLNLGNARANFDPRLSQGVNNIIELTYKDKLYCTNFKLHFAKEKEELFEFITLLIKLKKISFLRGIELLNINDYDDIQAFKKSVNIIYY